MKTFRTASYLEDWCYTVLSIYFAIVWSFIALSLVNIKSVQFLDADNKINITGTNIWISLD